MHRELRTQPGRALYARRKAIFERVFGLIMRARGFPQFLLRGLAQVRGDWALICTGRNLASRSQLVGPSSLCATRNLAARVSPVLL